MLIMLRVSWVHAPHPNVHCSTVYNSQGMETSQMSIDRGVDKEDVVHIYNGILLSHKRNKIVQRIVQNLLQRCGWT